MNPELWRQIEPILDGALDLPADERSSFLERACGGDETVFRAVEALLVDCESSGSFLEGAGGAALAEVAAQSAFDPLALDRIGTRLGPYRLLRILGRGGMGTVYLAERVDGQYEQQVAIKVANRQDLDEDAAERFRFERQLLARLEHPNIARLLDGGVTGDDTPYLVMELVDGLPLDLHCKNLPVTERLRLLQEVGRAVAYAHRRQIVHRDLKPSNVLVTKSGQVKLLDFGVAELLNPGGDGELLQAPTDSGSDRLTLGYAAPELLQGKKVTDACDVYSLGVLLYRLLTGHLPFDARDLPVPRFIDQVVHDAVPPPSAVAAQVSRGTSTLETFGGASGAGHRELDAMTLKALAKDPSDRYSSAEAMVEDLERYQRGLPLRALPPTMRYRTTKHFRRNRWQWLAAGIATALLVILSTGWINSRRQATARAEIAQRFGQEAERIEWFLRHAQALPKHDIRREQRLMEERLERLQLQIHELGPLAQGPGNFALGRSYARLNQPQRAFELLQEAWRSGYRTAEVALSLGKALGTLYDEKRNDALRIRDPDLRAAQIRELETRYRDRALRFLSQAGSPELESSNALFGLIAFYDGRFEEALRRAREARQEAPWLVEGYRLEGDVYLAKAALNDDLDLPPDSIKSFEASLEAYSQALELAPSDPTLYERMCNGWALHLDRQRMLPGANQDLPFQSGLERCRQALEVNSDSETAWHLLSTLFMVRLQDPSLEQDRVLTMLIEAETAVRRALELDPLLTAAHHTLGTVALSRALRIEQPGGEDPQPSLDRAAESFRRSLEIDPGFVKSYANLGTTLAVRAGLIRARGGDPRPAFEEAIASFKQALDRSPGKVLLLYNLANLHRDKAEVELAQGLDSTLSWQLAAQYTDDALAANPHLVPALNLRGALEEGLARQQLVKGQDPTRHLELAWAAFERTLEVDPTYFRAATNQASTALLQARFEAAQGLDPQETLARALEASDRARSLSTSTAEFVFHQLGDTRLLRAEITLARGEPAEQWLEQASRHFQEGLAVHPLSSPLGIGAASVELLRERSLLTVKRETTDCLAAPRVALSTLIERNPKDGAASFLLAEADLWCAVRAPSQEARESLLASGRGTLAAAAPALFHQPSREVLSQAFAFLEGRGEEQELRDAIGDNRLLLWRFDPILRSRGGSTTARSSAELEP